MKFPVDKLHFTKDGFWLFFEGDLVTIGLSHAHHHDPITVTFDTEEGDHLIAGDNFGSIDFPHRVHNLFSPINADVLEINDELAADPQILEGNAYGTWLIKVKIKWAFQLPELLSWDDLRPDL